MGRIYAIGLTLSIVPVPYFGVNLFFPLVMLLIITRTGVSKSGLNMYKYVVIYMCLLSIINYIGYGTEKALVVINIMLSMSVVLIVQQTKSSDWLYAGIFHVVLLLMSYIGLYIYGFDVVSNMFYGESRHLIGIYDSWSYRASGVFQEPSTYSYHMLAIVMIMHFIDRDKNLLSKVILLVFSMLSFSVLSLVSLVLIVYLFYKEERMPKIIFPALLLTPILIYFLPALLDFSLYKVELYNSDGLENVTRFKSLFALINDFSALGFSYDLIQKYVIYDLGPFFSLTAILGIFAIPILLILALSVKRNPILFLILITKISLTNPLLWMLVKKVYRHEK